MNHLTLRELSARLDGALSGAALESAERHLTECAHCRQALAALTVREASLRPLLEHDPGEGYFETFAGRVEDRIRAAGLSGAQARLGDGWLGWLRSPRRLAWAGAAAAMVVGIAVVLVMARIERPALKPEIATRVEQQEAAPPGTVTPPATTHAVPDEVAASQKLEADQAKSRETALQDQQKPDVSTAADVLASKRSADRSTASTSRLTEVRRSAAGEDVPVRSNVPSGPVAEAEEKAAVQSRDGTKGIVKPGAAQPMSESPSGFAAGPADAMLQRADETRLCGRVLDPKGHPVAGAVVALADVGRTAKTDASGRFCLSAPAGTHDLTAMAVGFGSSRMQVRAEGQTTDAQVTLSPVSVLEGANRATGGTLGSMTFSKDPDKAFAVVTDRARTLIRTAERLTLGARTASQLDAAAAAWQDVVGALSPGEARLEALDRTAETRYRAWQLGPNARRARAAQAALSSFLEAAPQGARRDLAERWRELVRP